MSTTVNTDFKIYQEYLKTRASEVLTQNGEVFNAASNGAVIMRSNATPGDYEYESFFKNISGLISRRDTTSTSDATSLKMTQDEFIRVKLNRMIGPVETTRDAFRKLFARYSAEEVAGILGVQIANAAQLEMVNTCLKALRAALDNQSSVKHTIASSGTMTTSNLVDGLALFGDRADRVVLWVMHSKVYYNLVKEQISAKIDGIANFNVQTGTPVTLNRPVLVTDSDSLKITSGSPAVTDYYTLGLTAGSMLAEMTELEDVVNETVTGKANLIERIQGEYAYNIGLKGFKWDTTNGGVNPSDTAIGTGSNWDPAVSSYKDYAGIVIKSR